MHPYDADSTFDDLVQRRIIDASDEPNPRQALIERAFRRAREDGSYYAEVLLLPEPGDQYLVPVVAEDEPKVTLVMRGSNETRGWKAT